MKKIAFSNLFLIFVFICIRQANATTLLQMNFDDLVTISDGIVAGTVHNIESYYDDQNEIYTDITLKDLDIINGIYNQNTLTIRLNGGEVAGHVLFLEGAPRFDLNDRVILFLLENGKILVPIAGWTQGVFRVITDPSTAKKTVRDHQGNRVFSIAGDRIVKENIYSETANLVDKRTGMAIVAHDDGQSTGGFSFEGPDGTIRNSTLTGNMQKETLDSPDKPAIEVEAFVLAIKNKLKEKGKEKKIIVNFNRSEYRASKNFAAKPTGDNM